MAAKTWESDFRYPAIQASIRQLGDGYYDDAFRFPGSFCLPIAEKPLVGLTPGRIYLVALVLGFALMGGGVFLVSRAERHAPGFDRSLMTGLAVTCSLAGILTFFVPAKFDQHVISWLIGERGREMRQRSRGLRSMSAELSNPETSNKISIDGDDHVLIVFDDENGRLMIEGIGARYQIRAADVETLAPFQALNYIGVEIACRIDTQTTLHIAIARVSLLYEVTRQVPILFFLRKRIPNKLLNNCTRTLQPQ